MGQATQRSLLRDEVDDIEQGGRFLGREGAQDEGAGLEPTSAGGQMDAPGRLSRRSIGARRVGGVAEWQMAFVNQPAKRDRRVSAIDPRCGPNFG